MNIEFKSPLLNVLSERGFIKDCTDIAALDEAMANGPVPAYIGFDLTAPALHVGSLIQLMVLRHIRTAAQNAGFGQAATLKTINVIFGDATTRVGDPSDKNGARPILTSDQIELNRQGIVRCIDTIVGPCTDHHNSTWLDSMTFMDFLTGPARHFSVNRMVASDIVARRLENDLPMTLMEMIYSAMQAMDFAELARNHGIRLQVGGSDQWSNIISGVDLARRTDGNQIFGITTPLMLDAQGRKMGKTSGGQTVWLDRNRTSSFELWQFWRNVPDEKVREFLGLFTDLHMEDVERLGSAHGSGLNEAKEVLATAVVSIVHDPEAALEAAAAARRARTIGSPTDPLGSASLPTVTCPVDADKTLITIAELMVHAGLADSKAAARRLASQGGFRFNGAKLEHVDLPVEGRDFDNGQIILSAGKKRHFRVIAAETLPTKRPISTRIESQANGTFHVIGTWPWDENGVCEDIIASDLPDEEAAKDRARRVRLALQE